MPALGRRLGATQQIPMLSTLISAGPRLCFAFLAALLVASIARAKVHSLADIDGDGRLEDGRLEERLDIKDLANQSHLHDRHQLPSHIYPLNLHRDYDGAWESVEQAPPFSDLSLVASTATVGPSSLSRAEKLAVFDKMSGFASLNAENYEHAELGPDLHYVLGELLLRDGSYRTSHDLELGLIGVYEHRAGLFLLVGDFIDDEGVLERLYKLLSVKKPDLALQEADFISIMAPVLKQQREHRQGETYSKKKMIQKLCPFHAVYRLSSGHYTDSPPRSRRYGAANNGEKDYVKMTGVISSPLCGTSLTSSLSTVDTEKLFVKAINYTLLVTFVAFTQVLVLIRQMEMTSTQAGANRVSLLTVGLQTISDSYLCLAHLIFGIAFRTLFNAFATAAFFKFIIFSIFEMRYLLMIWKARRSSGFAGGWESMRRELSILYSRFYGSLLLGIVIVYEVQDHTRLFMFVLYSFWVPQIVLNVTADHRRPLHPLYIVGMSATRLAIPTYFWCCPRNFLHIQPQPFSGLLLTCWVTAQACVLLLQHRFGARWFVPRRFLPEKYDYYRALTAFGGSPGAGGGGDRYEDPEIDEPTEAKLTDVGAETSAGTFAFAGGTPHVEVDCVICMQNVAVNGPHRMATPCDHVFHEECLQQWMDVKMECPTCRRILPPP